MSKKKASDRKGEHTKPAKKQEPPVPSALPDIRVIEGTLFDLFGGGPRSAVDRAQEMMYDAWECEDPVERVRLALKALEVSPKCADAYVLLAEEASETVEEAIEFYRKGVDAGERAIGKKNFGDYEGSFWGFIETRPYMRARAGLAQCLWTGGAREEAVAHYQEMLRLNPNDNQGIRYILAACLLDLGRDKEVASLVKQYRRDTSAAWLYTAALLAFRKGGDTEKARKALAEALEGNKHVPAYLVGKKKLPSELPDFIGRGDKDEAICYAADNMSAWKATPGALEWLADHTKSL